jgi:cyanate permease
VLLDFAVQAVHVTSQNLIVAETPESSSRIISSYMICYSLGSALGAVTTAALYERAGWPAAATLGACYAAAALSVWTLDRVIPNTPRTTLLTPNSDTTARTRSSRRTGVMAATTDWTWLNWTTMATHRASMPSMKTCDADEHGDGEAAP